MATEIETRIAQMGANEARWFEVLTMASGRAINGDCEGVALADLSDGELHRVFDPCCGPKCLIEAVQTWRDCGRTFEDFMMLGTLSTLESRLDAARA
jgi:hypothetical protein